MLLKNGVHQRIRWIIFVVKSWKKSKNGHKSTEAIFPCQRQYVTRSDKRVTKGQFGHSESDISRKCNQGALIWHKFQNCALGQSEVMVVVEWPCRENGAERIDTALVKVGFCHLKCVLKPRIGQNG